MIILTRAVHEPSERSLVNVYHTPALGHTAVTRWLQNIKGACPDTEGITCCASEYCKQSTAPSNPSCHYVILGVETIKLFFCLSPGELFPASVCQF